MLKLVKVSEKYLPSVIKVVDEFRKFPKEFGRGSIESLLQAIDDGDISAWIKQKQGEEKGINLKPGYVSGTYYWLMEGDEYIGSFTLRHQLTESLMKIGGNIAYIILPSKRGQGYASAGLTLCLQEAKKMGMDKVLITCNTRNNASFAVITKAMKKYGGEMLPDVQIDDGFEHRVWVNTIA